MGELIAFLRNRIDDDEQEWRTPPRKLRSISSRMLGDVEARRRIIDRISGGDQTHDDLLVLMGLATRYFDHPDYRRKWWTYPDE
ncbi:DUF6221 family protein [Streptosporangium sp. NBC_01639]|uniref:DUF6221 family protein n=1 Tax=unclassified Streptosporangium TaxID=2632669 RepID=UPI002DD83C7D|nr:DUF6221 family protein [Streptosporangium sp. NBC_01756]WSC84683.1 DUF6221 family protein [Streptosporangium sp. NBC_01756]WTD56682.1 DUF6221 family protein [Streptosporangium sp. NBC_01639]